MCHEFIPRHLFINKLERYNEQDPTVYSNMITSACELAHQYHYQLRETILKKDPQQDPVDETEPSSTAAAASAPPSSSYDYINGEILHNVEHKAAIKMMGDKSFFRLEHDVGRGGLQAPYHVSSLSRIPFAAANIGLGGAYVSNTSAVVRLLDHYPNIQAKASLIGDMIHGDSHGAVCLTERHSNISLTDVR
jgi:alkylation response protein AidB-like acyl-CoA dehydrogenase